MNSVEVIGESVSETSVGILSSESGISSNETINLSTNPTNPQVDIKEFIHSQLKENIRDRLFMLNIERDLINFIKNEKDEYYKFQAMNPYYRMLTHRICDYFGLGHNLDNLKQSVIVFKIADKTRMPLVNFQSIINDSAQQKQVNSQASVCDSGSASRSDSSSSSSKSLTPNTSSNNLNCLQQEQKNDVECVKIEKKQILKRDTNDQENEALRNKQLSKRASDIKPKTFEEKSAEYNRIKNRIFNNIQDNSNDASSAPLPTQNQKPAQAQNNASNQQVEMKQYKILNRQNKPISNENGNRNLENFNTQQPIINSSNQANGNNQINKTQNSKKNLNHNKTKQVLQNQSSNGQKMFIQNQNFKPIGQQNMNTMQQQLQPQAQNQGAFRQGQMVHQFPPQQFFFMNQNPNFQQQFTNPPINPVMFPGMSHMVPNGAYPILSNQTPSLLMPSQVPPFLQIPNVQNNSQKNSPVRPSPQAKPKFSSPMNRKPQTKNNCDKIKNIKFQVYNLSPNLTRAKLNELLGPYVHKMEIVDKKANSDDENNRNAFLDESTIDILIEFDNFDKLEEAFKDLNLNGNQQSTKPFLIKPVC